MQIFSPSIINNLTGSIAVFQGISGSQFSGSYIGNGSGITNVVSASYALSASWSSILNNLPIYIDDSAAISGGLSVGDFYVVDTGNDAIPAGLVKKILS
jgi:hypothetical protein